MRKILFFATVATVFFASCRKNNDAVAKPAETSPVTKTFFQTIPVTIAATGLGNYEYGFNLGLPKMAK